MVLFSWTQITFPSRKKSSQENLDLYLCAVSVSNEVLISLFFPELELQFTATWGDHHYLGLTGLEVVGSEGEAIPVTLDMMAAQPSDLRHLPGNEKDDRTLDK